MYEAVIMAGNCVVCGEYSLVTNVLQGDRGFLDKIGRGGVIFLRNIFMATTSVKQNVNPLFTKLIVD